MYTFKQKKERKGVLQRTSLNLDGKGASTIECPRPDLNVVYIQWLHGRVSAIRKMVYYRSFGRHGLVTRLSVYSPRAFLRLGEGKHRCNDKYKTGEHRSFFCQSQFTVSSDGRLS